MADSTLSAIQTKVRRLTRNPSVSQLTDVELNEYINTFVIYDFPEHLRLFTLRTTLSFWTTPFVDVYDSNVLAPNPLVNFKNVFTTIAEPLYIAGYQGKIYQDRNTFFNIFPFNSFESQIGTGDGVTTVFTGTLTQAPVLQHEVTFNSVDVLGTAVVMHDVPLVDVVSEVPTIEGNLYVPGNEPADPPTVLDATNTLNYSTGVFTVTFATAPAANQAVNVQSVPYTAARPDIMLYYHNKFTLRPVPDQAYKVTMDAYKRPSELLQDGSEPELEQWWQYIAYGAAKKVLEDRMDTDTIQQILPEFYKQERLVLRRTVVNQTKERVSTIYTDQLDGNGYSGYGNWGI